MEKQKKKLVRYRSAITGRFVTKKFADQHKATTVKVTIETDV